MIRTFNEGLNNVLPQLDNSVDNHQQTIGTIKAPQRIFNTGSRIQNQLSLLKDRVKQLELELADKELECVQEEKLNDHLEAENDYLNEENDRLTAKNHELRKMLKQTTLLFYHAVRKSVNNDEKASLEQAFNNQPSIERQIKMLADSFVGQETQVQIEKSVDSTRSERTTASHSRRKIGTKSHRRTKGSKFRNNQRKHYNNYRKTNAQNSNHPKSYKQRVGV